MPQLFKLTAILGVILFVSACSPRLTPFTQDLYNDFDWSNRELKRIQFYLSEDIVLRREASRGTSRIEDGEIKIVNGERIEEIVFERGTPGIFVDGPDRNRFAISFEPGKDKFLVFGPSQRYNGRYTLKAKDWNRNRGIVTYNGKRYRTSSQSAYASLLVDLRAIKDTKVKKRKAEGQTVK